MIWPESSEIRLVKSFYRAKFGRWFPRDGALNWKLLSIKIMPPSRGVQRSGYNFESTLYDNCVSQAGLLVTVNVLLAL